MAKQHAEHSRAKSLETPTVPNQPATSMPFPALLADIHSTFSIDLSQDADMSASFAGLADKLGIVPGGQLYM
eukprot:CAMPEP_0177633852 /NCGR_PEP_ID=MMETSP0447-20121125/3059_1 /TAXON_ID=0 /ORGANISM="Stygamoeba regulata, Strain BSH-02190019" /LENGTH=71 /DNA_ID=CAMNT_0019135541 /DNA_START=601 /DNA_END=816 /DNA_ORIENTATION=+